MASDSIEHSRVTFGSRPASRSGCGITIPRTPAVSTSRTKRTRSSRKRPPDGHPAGEALRAGSLGGAPHLPGHGRGRQRRHDQARHVGPQPAGVRGAMPSRRRRRRSSITTFCGGPPACSRERGRIGIFNRSHYEEVLVVRVHPELLGAPAHPRRAPDQATIWEERFGTSTTSNTTSGVRASSCASSFSTSRRRNRRSGS